jgi:hypothetical protein
MKFSWMKWSVLPAAILLVGGVAVAQDQSSSGSQSSQKRQRQPLQKNPNQP